MRILVDTNVFLRLRDGAPDVRDTCRAALEKLREHDHVISLPLSLNGDDFQRYDTIRYVSPEQVLAGEVEILETGAGDELTAGG